MSTLEIIPEHFNLYAWFKDSGVPGVNILALRSITILDRKLKTERIETNLAAEAGVELDFIECDLEAITTDELKNKMRKAYEVLLKYIEEEGDYA